MIKPDGVQRGLVGEIIKKFERKGFKLVAMKYMMASKELLKQHYAEHEGKAFFDSLVNYMSSGPIVPMVWEGTNIVKIGRSMLGATNPLNAVPGTIRGDFAVETGRNLCHASDAVESAQREIELWFNESEIVAWTSNMDEWIYEP